MKVMGDILTTNEGELLMQGGDVLVGDALLYHQRDIVVSNPGEWKQNPATGVGIAEYLDDDDPEAMTRLVRQQLTLDGQRVEKVQYDDTGLKIRGWYE